MPRQVEEVHLPLPVDEPRQVELARQEQPAQQELQQLQRPPYDEHDPAQLDRPSPPALGSLPWELRMDFVKKVYGLVGAMLLISFLVASPYFFCYPDYYNIADCDPCFEDSNMTTRVVIDFGTVIDIPGNWTGEMQRVCARCASHYTHTVVTIVAWVIMFFLPRLLHCLSICRPGMSACFRTLMFTFPQNYIFLFAAAVMQGFFLAEMASNLPRDLQDLAPFVMLAMLLILLMVTVFAVWTKANLNDWPPYLAALAGGFCTVGLGVTFLAHGRIQDRLLSGFMATYLALIAVRETQKIFGVNATVAPRRMGIELTYDSYALAAHEVFLTTVVFLGLGC